MAVQNGSAVCVQGGPTTTYQFVGQCTDCNGTGIGLLTVQNYTLGNALTECNFVSFSYHSNLISYSVASTSDLFNLIATLPASLPATANVFIESEEGMIFESNVNGSWMVGETDFGSSSSWSLAPAGVPALGVPMLIGLAAMLALLGALLLKGLGKRCIA